MTVLICYSYVMSMSSFEADLGSLQAENNVCTCHSLRMQNSQQVLTEHSKKQTTAGPNRVVISGVCFILDRRRPEPYL